MCICQTLSYYSQSQVLCNKMCRYHARRSHKYVRQSELYVQATILLTLPYVNFLAMDRWWKTLTTIYRIWKRSSWSRCVNFKRMKKKHWLFLIKTNVFLEDKNLQKSHRYTKQYSSTLRKGGFLCFGEIEPNKQKNKI